MARSRARSISKLQRLLVWRGNGWHAPFGASPPSFVAGGESICFVIGKARARERVARTESLASLRASAKQSSRLAQESGLLRRCRSSQLRGPKDEAMILTSSLPDLIRQSMRTGRKLDQQF
jgi:hypothetical protein